MPIALPLLLATPLAVLTSQVRFGERLRAAGMLATPEETRTPSVLRHAWARLRQPALTPRWTEAALDPRLFELRDRPAANSEFGALIEAGARRSREKRVVP